MLISENGLYLDVTMQSGSISSNQTRYSVGAILPQNVTVDGFVLQRNYKWKLDGIEGVLLVEDARVHFLSPGPGREVTFTFLHRPDLDFGSNARMPRIGQDGTLNLSRATGNQSATRLVGDADEIGTEIVPIPTNEVEPIVLNETHLVDDEIEDEKKSKKKGGFFTQFANLLLDGL